MSHSPGILCLSVDSRAPDSLSIETSRRRQELVELTERYDVSSNWTVSSDDATELPANAEATVDVPKGLDRRELIQHLRQSSATLLKNSSTLHSVVVDPHEARSQWDVLVRQGCVVARARTATVTSDVKPRIVRGGLWVVPMTCQFVGGSRRSVRSLFSVCQRQLVDAAQNAGVFHLNVDVGNSRESWNEEKDALRALFETANDQRRKQHLRCVRLSELPAILTRKANRPQLSILKRAA